jgi:uncharacterized protein (TIGR03083 family)
LIHTQHLFKPLDTKLIELLRSLSVDDWNRPTIAPMWTVKDIASHLLDTNIRALSSGDNYRLKPNVEIKSYQDLVDYLNKLNADWVMATKRLSPQILTELLEITGKKYSAHIMNADMNIQAPISVAWAGEEHSVNWFHIAREFTEKWHHQQQIRDAVGKPGIMTKEFFYPVMDTFMRGLPFRYRDIRAAENSVVRITISTEIGGQWFLIRTDNAWELTTTAVDHPDASITLGPDTAWKLFTKGIKPEAAKSASVISGNEQLAEPAFKLIAVIA